MILLFQCDCCGCGGLAESVGHGLQWLDEFSLLFIAIINKSFSTKLFSLWHSNMHNAATFNTPINRSIAQILTEDDIDDHARRDIHISILLLMIMGEGHRYWTKRTLTILDLKLGQIIFGLMRGIASLYETIITLLSLR